jgi:F0F1-type ATP synthase assembly protein I
VSVPESQGSDSADDERKRLAELDARLKAVSDRNAATRHESGAQELAGQGTAWRLVSSFVTATAAGTLIGWFVIDHLLKAPPWGIIIGTFAGFAAGLTVLIRAGQRANAPAAPTGDSSSAPPVDRNEGQ